MKKYYIYSSHVLSFLPLQVQSFKEDSVKTTTTQEIATTTSTTENTTDSSTSDSDAKE